MVGFLLQAVDELKKKLEGLRCLHFAQLQSVQTVVNAHESVSTSTFKALDSTVTAHPSVLEEVYFVNLVAPYQEVVFIVLLVYHHYIEGLHVIGI